MQQRRNARARDAIDPRENPPTSGIVRHDSRVRKSSPPPPRPGIESGSPRWEARSLTATPPRPPAFLFENGTVMVDPNPCLHGGVGIIRNKTIVCLCRENYGGYHCEYRTDVCQVYGCVNSSSACTPLTGGGFSCSGARTSCCDQQVCPEGWRCVPDDDSSRYSCEDVPGRKSQHCQDSSKNFRADNVCQNGGQCRDSSCLCQLPFTGILCELVVDYCKTYPCPAGIACLPRFGGYTCQCPSNYMGIHCDTPRQRREAGQIEDLGFLYNNLQHVGKSSVYCLHAASLGISPHVLVKIGKDARVELRTEDFVSVESSRENIMSSCPSQFQPFTGAKYLKIFHHEFENSGVHNISIVAKNMGHLTARYSYSVRVEQNTQCNLSTVLYHCAQSSASPTLYTRRSPIAIMSRTELNCPQFHVRRRWNLYRMLESNVTRNEVEYDLFYSIGNLNSYLSIPAFTLPAGEYYVNLAEYMETGETNISSHALTWFSVETLPLRAIITGGLLINQYRGNEVEIDASKSYDPNVPKEEQEPLSFSWSCSLFKGKQRAQKGRHMMCNEMSELHLNSTGSKLVLPASSLPPNSIVLFRAFVSKTPHESVMAEQYVKLVGSDTPLLRIRCWHNCEEERVDPNKVTSLEAYCVSCKNMSREIVDSRWDINPSIEPSRTEFGLENPLLLIYENALENEKQYRIVFNAVHINILKKGDVFVADNTGQNLAGPPLAAIAAAALSGMLSMSVCRTSTGIRRHSSCNHSNSPQRCSRGLRSGLWAGQSNRRTLLLAYHCIVALETWHLLPSWQLQSLPPQYQLDKLKKAANCGKREATGFQTAERPLRCIMADDECLTMYDIGPHIEDITLAAGTAESNYLTSLKVYVADRLGVYSHYDYNVTVMPFVTHSNPYQALLKIKSMGAGKKSRLALASAAGNTRDVVQTVMTLAISYFDLMESEEAKAHIDSDIAVRSKYEVREMLLKYLQREPILTVSGCKHAATTLEKVLGATDGYFNSSSTRLAIDVLSRIVSFLHSSYAQEMLHGTDVHETGTPVVAIVSSLLSTLARTDKQLHYFSNTVAVEARAILTREVLDALKHFAKLLLLMNAREEHSTSIYYPDITITYKHSSFENLQNDDSILSVVEFDDLNSMQNYHLHFYMVRFKRNPFPWHHSSQSVVSPVVFSDLRYENGTPVAVGADISFNVKLPPVPRVSWATSHTNSRRSTEDVSTGVLKVVVPAGGKLVIQVHGLGDVKEIRFSVKKNIPSKTEDFWSESATVSRENANVLHGRGGDDVLQIADLQAAKGDVFYVGVTPVQGTADRLPATTQRRFHRNAENAEHFNSGAPTMDQDSDSTRTYSIAAYVLKCLSWSEEDGWKPACEAVSLPGQVLCRCPNSNRMTSLTYSSIPLHRVSLRCSLHRKQPLVVMCQQNCMHKHTTHSMRERGGKGGVARSGQRYTGDLRAD
ncbi:hypothetical protein PR048_003691 [Dryococelus australis]|uniref:EGF-like domain-containing protein n=1 Tax=Dryococelus australis TaxID=614101 RepID=A0ABQ9INV2_9NEOP|nr:hypothetical protein PR048_003691 [Dryococelus australis]